MRSLEYERKPIDRPLYHHYLLLCWCESVAVSSECWRDFFPRRGRWGWRRSHRQVDIGKEPVELQLRNQRLHRRPVGVKQRVGKCGGSVASGDATATAPLLEMPEVGPRDANALIAKVDGWLLSGAWHAPLFVSSTPTACRVVHARHTVSAH